MNVKRMLAFMTAVMMICLMLCACGGDTEASDPTNETTTAPTETQLVIPSFTTKPQDDGKVTYTVTVLDQNNNPVAGVTVQFCDEENCKMPVDTDENGMVTGKYAASEYHITLVQLPDGYTCEETVFYFGDETDLTIVVNAQ